ELVHERGRRGLVQVVVRAGERAQRAIPEVLVRHVDGCATADVVAARHRDGVLAILVARTAQVGEAEVPDIRHAGEQRRANAAAGRVVRGHDRVVRLDLVRLTRQVEHATLQLYRRDDARV